MLDQGGYVASENLATAVYLAIQLHKPLLIEGATGVGKTEVAKVMARVLETDLIRLQCYEGLDATTSLYEWNYQRQLLHIRLLEQAHSEMAVEAKEREIFSEPFLLKRPLLEAITHHKSPVLLIDEIDRCVSAEALIATSEGVQRAAEVRPGSQLLSFDPPTFALRRSTVKKVIPRKTRQLIRLFVGGRFLEVTREHRFVRFTDDGYESVRASELKVGDRIPLCKAIPEFVPEDPSFAIADSIIKITASGRELLYKAYKASGRTYDDLASQVGVSRGHLGNVLQPTPFRRALRYGVLQRLSAALDLEGSADNSAYIRGVRVKAAVSFYELLGYIVADGCFTSDRVSIVDKDRNNLEVYAKKFEEAFGVEPRIVPGPHRNYALCFWSLPLGRFLKRVLGPAVDRSRRRTLPPFLYRLPAPHRAAFLRGYFDGEGWVADHQVIACSASPYLLVGVQHLLTSVGIDSHISRGQEITSYGSGPFYNLSISDVQSFQRIVGFCSTAKVERLARIVKPHSFTVTETLPRGMVFEALNRVRASQVLHTIPSHQTVYDILAGRVHPNMSAIRRLAVSFSTPEMLELPGKQIVLGKITRLETVSKSCTVYDFVLDGDPYFVANQVVTHNCEEEWEAFLLEVLSDWQVTIPEIGTIKARNVPYVILTSNRTRELGDALRRRCLYLWIDYPTFEKELAIVERKLPGLNAQLARQIAAFMQFIRHLKLEKIPGIAETLDWSAALIALHRDHLDKDAVLATLGALCKHRDDAELLRTQWLDVLLRGLDDIRREPQPWTQDTIDRVARTLLAR